MQISNDGGSYPLWSRKGNEIYCRLGDRMMVVEITSGASEVDPMVSAPKTLFEQKDAFFGNTVAAYDATADGERFLVVKPEPTANPARRIDIT